MAKSKKAVQEVPVQEVPEELTTFPLLKEKVEPVKEEPKKTEKVVIACVLNVREAPSFGAKIVATIEKGTKVKILGEADDWTRIGDKKWVYSEYIE